MLVQLTLLLNVVDLKTAVWTFTVFPRLKWRERDYQQSFEHFFFATHSFQDCAVQFLKEHKNGWKKISNALFARVADCLLIGLWMLMAEPIKPLHWFFHATWLVRKLCCDGYLHAWLHRMLWSTTNDSQYFQLAPSDSPGKIEYTETFKMTDISFAFPP